MRYPQPRLQRRGLTASQEPVTPSPLDRTLAYHERTKHRPERFAASLGYMDWDTQPNPFRRYEGAPLLALDLVEAGEEPRFEPVFRRGEVTPRSLDRQTISILFQDSLGLSAWKQVTDSGGQVRARWPLRMNPSSGNLHPTEAYLISGPIPDVVAHPGVFHYAPHDHGLELRRKLTEDEWSELARDLPTGAFLVGLTSIHWRESWKYGERAFRYCHHDVGHAIAALAVAAAGLGWDVTLLENTLDSELAGLLGTIAQRGVEAEHPDCLLAITSQAAQRDVSRLRVPASLQRFRPGAWFGQPNRLSADHHEWPTIEEVAEATHREELPPESLWELERAENHSLKIEESPVSLRKIIHQRRSCVALDGRSGISRAAFYQILLKVVPGEGQVPFHTLPWRPRIDLVLFVHRVQDMEPGLYVLLRDSSRRQELRQALRSEFVWERPSECPASLPLFLLRTGDYRSTARALSCDQDIAADGVFAVAMLADYRRSLETFGPWFYRRLHWEAGVVGQAFYLEAEATGIRGTGIGCFFDDPTHEVLGVEDDTFADLYHFTMGVPVDDRRLQTRPPYEHLNASPQSTA